MSGDGQRRLRTSASSAVGTKSSHVFALLAVLSMGTYLTSSIVFAQTAMVDLGTLPGGYSSNAFDVSADGTVVVGQSVSNQTGETAFRWTASVGMTTLSGIPAGVRSGAIGVSGNGRIVVGNILGEFGKQKAFRWSEFEGVTLLMGLSVYDRIDGRATNFDGTVIVGEWEAAELVAVYPARAFRWTEATGMTNLGTLAGLLYSGASDVSADGSVVVGSAFDDLYSRAFRWTATTGMEDLGTLPMDEFAFARGTSSDGSVVVGGSGRYILIDGEQDQTYHAFRWTRDGGMQDLGTLSGGDYSGARDVNADGTVVVGSSGNLGVSKHAFRWTQAGGMEDLGTLDGALYSEAYGVNADGTVVVGYSDFGNGVERAFIWRGAIQDYSNLTYSFVQMADATQVALQQNTDLLENGIDSTCSVKSGYSYCVSLSGGAQSAESPAEDGGWDNEAEGFGTLAVGLGATDNLTIGAVLTSFSGSDADFAEWNSPALGVGAYALYSNTGDYLTGLNAGVRGGMSSSEMSFIRGSNLSDVQVSHSDADVQSYVAIAEASYGFAVNDNWVVSPTARLKWAQSERDGYTEDGSLAFSTQYDSATEETLALGVGLDQRFAINEQNAIRLGGGAEFDISYNDAEVSGTSNMPGMSNFEITPDLDRNNWRGYADVEHQFLFGPEKQLTTRVYLETPTYGSEAVLGASASLRLSF